METVQSSVPYTTLRALAASNDGALEIGSALEQNHPHVWHKMGDDDMPVFNPNPVQAVPEGKTKEQVDQERVAQFYDEDFKPGDELTALQSIEATKASNATTVVTFGYNLTTDFLPKSNVQISPAIATALRALYRIEMEVRDQIRDLRAPIYPSEPTSFYRTVKGNNAADVWRGVPDAKTGGSGQQLEGAKLVLTLKNNDPSKQITGSKGKTEKEPEPKAKARNESPTKATAKSVKGNSVKESAPTSSFVKPEPKMASGIIQFAFHTVQVDTSAGGRNDNLVTLLNNWLVGRDASKVDEAAVEAEINKLDQCALKKGEYLDKVLAKLPKPSDFKDSVVGQIEKLISDERARAAIAVCTAIRSEIANPMQPQANHGVGQQGVGQPAPVQHQAQAQQQGQPVKPGVTRDGSPEKKPGGQGGSSGSRKPKK
jgi:hypothetical protein